jgi:hypothetical protein
MVTKFHQFQQKKQSPVILTELTVYKKTMTCDVGNPGPGLGQAQKYARAKPVNGVRSV